MANTSNSENRNNENRNNENRNRNNRNRNNRYRGNNNRNQARSPNRSTESVKKDPNYEIKEQQMAHEFFKTAEEEIRNCPYCDKPVKFLSTAISVGGEENPVHFDCLLAKMQEREELSENQKITYLGKGSFGVVEIIKESPGFKIIKKIDIETSTEKAGWRKEMSNRIHNYTVNK